MTFSDAIYLNLKAYSIDDYEEIYAILKDDSQIPAYPDTIYYLLFGIANYILRYEILMTYNESNFVSKTKYSSFGLLHLIAENLKTFAFEEAVVASVPIFKKSIDAISEKHADINATSCRLLSLKLKQGPLFIYTSTEFYTELEHTVNTIYIPRIAELIYAVYACKIFSSTSNLPTYVNKLEPTVKGKLINKFLIGNNEKTLF